MKGSVWATLPRKTDVVKLKAPKTDLASDLKLDLKIRSQAYWRFSS